MGMLNRLGKKNKKSKHYQKNYEEQQKDSQVNIRDNSEGIPKDVLSNRTEYYDEVRKNITGTDKKRIKKIGEMAKNIDDVFRRMEGEGLPLEYVVALGLAEEIDIESYHDNKLKGIESHEGDDEEEVDEDIKEEILGYEEEMPEIIRDIDEEDEEEDVEEETEGSKQIEKFISMFTKGKTEDAETNEESETENSGEGNIQENDNNQEKRKVFVIGTNVEIPELEDYEVVKIDDMENVTSYTSTRRDLLVITNDVPKGIQKPLLEWFKGVSDSDRKYRMVTLKGNELEHDLVEDVIELTDDSINSYFDNFKDEIYMEDDVGDFRDISDLLD